MEPLGEVLTQLSKGGGAKGINIDDVSRQLEELTKKYPFQVPNLSPVSDKLVSFNLVSLSLRAPPHWQVGPSVFLAWLSSGCAGAGA